jgi:hypothetical protein
MSNGLLRPDDFVLLESSGSWVLCRTIARLVMPVDPPAARCSASPSTPTLPVAPAKDPTCDRHTRQDFKIPAPRIEPEVQWVRQPIRALEHPLGTDIRPWSPRPNEGDEDERITIRQWLSTTRRGLVKVVSVILVMGTIAILVMNLPNTEQKACNRLNAIWEELRQKRESNADEKSWDEFAMRSTRKLAAIREVLEQSTDVRPLVREELLLAANEFLPQMLVDARLTPTESEMEFQNCLVRVMNVMHGRTMIPPSH